MSQTKTNSLLPANATAEERALSLAAQLCADILPEDIRTLWQPWHAALRFLPFLAWACHVDFWLDEMSEESKRAYIASSWEWHRHKGTTYAIRRAIEEIGFKRIRIDEWYTLQSQPHTFAVEIYPLIEKYARFAERSIREYKPARSHLLWIAWRVIFGPETITVKERFKEQVAADLSEAYPWRGIYYNGRHKYGNPKDQNCVSYGDQDECEKFVLKNLCAITEYMWEPYCYDSTYNYDGKIRYGSGLDPKETLTVTYQLIL